MFSIVDAAPVVLEAGQAADFRFAIAHRAGLLPNAYAHHMTLAPPDRNVLRARTEPPVPVLVSVRCPRPQPVVELSIEQGK